MKNSNPQTRKYIYSGPPSGATLDDGQEVLFFDGKEYPLPSSNKYIQGLEDQGYLSEVKDKPDPKPEPKPDAAKSKKTTSKEKS